ncbi:hypothetical protein [Sulfuricurvum sp.]|uniref:hypothetical protein n=1 Tax=Sulfuricurvum sp. TaxID=2025608 RepID=UPI00261EA633|nr:hypothetical protein [Sulfuricurvum sp.]MDD2267444.1 hypothetical protein [Sulfuricurvum sp.]MDD2782834.1 hypothetical protein [Sulfuricurvum sp.]
MNNIEFKALIEEQKKHVIKRHAQYMDMSLNGKLHNNDKDFSTYVSYSKSDFDLSRCDDLDELIEHLQEFKTSLQSQSKMYGFHTDIEIYASEDYVERSHVNAIWYYVRTLNDEFIENTAIKLATDILSEVIKPDGYDLKARKIDHKLIPLFLGGSMDIEALRELTYNIDLCDY